MAKRKILFVVISCIVISIALLLFFFPTSKKTNITTITPAQRSIVGETTESDLENLPDVIATEQVSESETHYTLRSFINILPDKIIAKDGVVVYEKVTLPTSKDKPESRSISQITNIYGPPERKEQGSVRFGQFLSTYIYASRGFAFAGNSNTDTVHEMEFFKPMSVNEYLVLYGKGIQKEYKH